MGKDFQEFLAQKTKNKTLAEVARGIGVSESFLCNLRAGKIQSTSLDVAINMALYFKEPLEKILKLLGKEDYLPKIKNVVQTEWLQEPKIVLASEGEPSQIKEKVPRYQPIKLLPDPASLGPGYEISQIYTDEYALILESFLPKGWKSDKDRIVAFRTRGISMKPTINNGSIIWIDRMDVIPKEGEIYAFLLKDFGNLITIKRLIKIDRHFLIIDGDNSNPEDRKTEELKDFPMVLNLKEYEHEDISPIRGRVIWALNRLIEKSNEEEGNK
jgi:transcriptional regulator with XRE-family HTH domain